MSGRSPIEKMRFKPGMSVALLQAPPEVVATLGLPDETATTDDVAVADFILVFVTTQAEAEEAVTMLAPHVGEKTLAWVAYPKGSKAAGHDVNRDTVWRFAEGVGLTLVANVALDEKWSGLRLRKAGQR